MRVVVIGATGNVGLALTRALAQTDQVTEVVGVARRRPDDRVPGARWIAADITRDPLEPIFAGADAVVHLAWLIQPSRRLDRLHAVNVVGTANVLDAVIAAGVPALVYASSIGAYSPRSGPGAVDESYPTHGIPTSSYARHKAYVERMLDDFEARHRGVRVVRLRPALIFQTEASAEQRRYFAGPFLPRALLRPGVLPVMPHLRDVRFQALHAHDVADAYRRALLSDVRGAFNLATDPVLTTDDIAGLLRARSVTVPLPVARAAMDITWRLRLHPLSPGWLDMAAQIPALDATRARSELGWTPAHDGREALRTVLRGIAEGAAGPTPPLQDHSVLQSLRGAVRTGVGQRASGDPRAQVDVR